MSTLLSPSRGPDSRGCAAAQEAAERAAAAEASARDLGAAVARLEAHAADLESRKRAPLYQKRQEEELAAAVAKAADAEARAAAAEGRAKDAKARACRPADGARGAGGTPAKAWMRVIHYWQHLVHLEPRMATRMSVAAADTLADACSGCCKYPCLAWLRSPLHGQTRRAALVRAASITPAAPARRRRRGKRRSARRPRLPRSWSARSAAPPTRLRRPRLSWTPRPSGPPATRRRRRHVILRSPWKMVHIQAHALPYTKPNPVTLPQSLENCPCSSACPGAHTEPPSFCCILNWPGIDMHAVCHRMRGCAAAWSGPLPQGTGPALLASVSARHRSADSLVRSVTLGAPAAHQCQARRSAGGARGGAGRAGCPAGRGRGARRRAAGAARGGGDRARGRGGGRHRRRGRAARARGRAGGRTRCAAV
jgi:hypothetical protein